VDVNDRSRDVTERGGRGQNTGHSEAAEREKKEYGARRNRGDAECLTDKIGIGSELDRCRENDRQQDASIALDGILSLIPGQLAMYGKILGVAVRDIGVIDRPPWKDRDGRDRVEEAGNEKGRRR
jgi:hypothetical protein